MRQAKTPDRRRRRYQPGQPAVGLKRFQGGGEGVRDFLEPGHSSITRRKHTQKWATCCTRRTCGPMMRDIASLNAGAVMADASLNRQQTIRVGAGVAFAHFSSVGFDGQIELEALRLFGLPEAAPAVLYACPSVPIGTRSLALETSWDLPSLAAAATANIDVTVPGARRGDFADASLDTSSIAFVLDCHVWLNHSVRVTARNVSASTVDLASAALSVRVVKRRPPWPIQKIGLLSHNNYFPLIALLICVSSSFFKNAFR